MTTYTPNPDYVGITRPPCTCGAAYRLHTPEALSGVRAGFLTCPRQYRPETRDVAERELAEAEAAGDPARVFVARGNLQRLTGRGGGWSGQADDPSQHDAPTVVRVHADGTASVAEPWLPTIDPVDSGRNDR